VIAMGFYGFSPAAMKFIEEHYNLGVVPFRRNWVSWQHTAEAQALLVDRDYLAQATPQQLFNLLTLLVRGDRISEGVLGNAYESGLLRRSLLAQIPSPSGPNRVSHGKAA
jgi:hypothetical protein